MSKPAGSNNVNEGYKPIEHKNKNDKITDETVKLWLIL
jgi:hypothetical protein